MDGRNPAPPKKACKTIAGWYLQGNYHSRVSSAVQDFVHPQYVTPLGMSSTNTARLRRKSHLPPLVVLYLKEVPSNDLVFPCSDTIPRDVAPCIASIFKMEICSVGCPRCWPNFVRQDLPHVPVARPPHLEENKTPSCWSNNARFLKQATGKSKSCRSTTGRDEALPAPGAEHSSTRCSKSAMSAVWDRTASRKKRSREASKFHSERLFNRLFKQ